MKLNSDGTLKLKISQKILFIIIFLFIFILYFGFFRVSALHFHGRLAQPRLSMKPSRLFMNVRYVKKNKVLRLDDFPKSLSNFATSLEHKRAKFNYIS